MSIKHIFAVHFTGAFYENPLGWFSINRMWQKKISRHETEVISVINHFCSEIQGGNQPHKYIKVSKSFTTPLNCITFVLCILIWLFCVLLHNQKMENTSLSPKFREWEWERDGCTDTRDGFKYHRKIMWPAPISGYVAHFKHISFFGPAWSWGLVLGPGACQGRTIAGETLNTHSASCLLPNSVPEVCWSLNLWKSASILCQVIQIIKVIVPGLCTTPMGTK